MPRALSLTQSGAVCLLLLAQQELVAASRSFRADPHGCGRRRPEPELGISEKATHSPGLRNSSEGPKGSKHGRPHLLS